MKMIFVNEQKVRRAKRILNLVTGKVIPRTQTEVDSMDNFSKILTNGGVDPKSEEAVEFLYKTFGGLVRTEAEQREADRKKKEMQLKGKKDKLGLK